jgi:hypothetical protein
VAGPAIDLGTAGPGPGQPAPGTGPGQPAPGSGLAIDDPAQAADYLSALTFGQINNRSLMGLVRLSEADLDAIIQGGVGVFLRAYRA